MADRRRSRTVTANGIMPPLTLTLHSTRMEIDRCDITSERTDAIVNAANNGLRAGGGVDGAIHRTGGPEILAACRTIGRCPTGLAVVTTGGRLHARSVIHAVGPIYAGLREDVELLASAYRESLLRAVEVGARSVSFPSIATGAYGYPIREAVVIALDTISQFVNDKPDAFDLLRFILFSDSDYSVYFEEFTRRGAQRG